MAYITKQEAAARLAIGVRTLEGIIARAQAAAYRMGLEEVLNADRVAEIFEGYDFGGGDEA